MILVLPTPEFIEELHESVLERYPGVRGFLHKNTLKSVIDRPKHFVTYEENCNLHKVCAVIVHTLAKNHPFTDANKRTALLTLLVVYGINGVDLKLDSEVNGELTTLLLWIVQSDPSIDEITAQLQELAEKHAKSGLEKALEGISDFVATVVLIKTSTTKQ